MDWNIYNKKTYSYLYTDNLVEELNVQKAVLEELQNFPEISELIPAEKITSEKGYASIKNEKSDVPVGGFKSFGDDEKARQKKIASAEKVLREKLGAKGYIEIKVIFNSWLKKDDVEESDFEKKFNKAAKLFKVDPIKKDVKTGELYPTVSVYIWIHDENGIPLCFPYTYSSGKKEKGYESPKEAKKNDDEFDLSDYYYSGYVKGSESVRLENGAYDAQAFYKLYTEDMVREAVRKAALR